MSYSYRWDYRYCIVQVKQAIKTVIKSNPVRLVHLEQDFVRPTAPWSLLDECALLSFALQYFPLTTWPSFSFFTQVSGNIGRHKVFQLTFCQPDTTSSSRNIFSSDRDLTLHAVQ